jgi:hypothetical protein
VVRWYQPALFIALRALIRSQRGIVMTKKSEQVYLDDIEDWMDKVIRRVTLVVALGMVWIVCWCLYSMLLLKS